MDLPTCPSCRQSVLDEDAETCPFCGASMSARPGAAPAPVRPARPTGAAAPAERKPAARPASQASAAAQTAAKGPRPDDDPFAAPAGSTSGAVRLSPRPVKGRTFEVVCPMCETTGYAPPQAAGKEVRCPNPKCLVPVFTAPELPPAPAPAEPEPARTPVAGLAVAGLALVAVAGFAIWFFLLRERETPPGEPSGGPVATNNGTETPFTLPTTTSDKPDDTATGGSTVLTPEDMRKAALDRMVQATRDIPATDRLRPIVVRSTAEAFALAGNPEGAREQIARIDQSGVQWYRITPLVGAAWHQITAGQADTVKTSLDEAIGYATNLPPTGADPWQASTALSAALAATGRDDEALSQLRRSDNPQELQRAQAWSEWTAARALGLYDLDAFLNLAPLVPWTRPQPVAVAYVLGGHSRWDDAARWALLIDDPDVQAEASAAWAEALAATAPQQVSRVETAIQTLSPEGRAYVAARVALLLPKDNAAAEAWLQTAQQALDEVAAPQGVAVTSMQDILELEMPMADAHRRAAIAAAELARVQARAGRLEDAWQSIQQALAFARGSAPSVAVLEPYLNRLESSEADVRQELRSLLDLNSDDEARRRLIEYRRRLESQATAAQQRLELQERFLAAAAGWGLAGQVADEMEIRAAASDANEQEPFGRTSLPKVVAAQLQAAGDADRADTVETMGHGAPPGATVHEDIRATVASQAAAEPVQAARRLEGFMIQPVERQRWALRVAGRLVEEGAWDQAVRFLRALEDPTARSEGLDLIAAQAAARGDGNQVWTTFQDPSLKPEERIALGRGLVVGLGVAPKASAGGAAVE